MTKIVVLAIATTAIPRPAHNPRPSRVAFYNIRSGQGVRPFPGRPAPFAAGSDRTDQSKPKNAWGPGVMQKTPLGRSCVPPRISPRVLGCSCSMVSGAPRFSAFSVACRGLSVVPVTSVATATVLQSANPAAQVALSALRAPRFRAAPSRFPYQRPGHGRRCRPGATGCPRAGGSRRPRCPQRWC